MNPYFELVRHDVTEPFKYEVDQIYNLACPASPPHYQHNPIKTTKTSVLGAIHCLGLAKRTGARVFQASTSEVYGDPDVHPQPESYHGNVNPIGIRACYDEGKRCAETLFFDYHRQNRGRYAGGADFQHLQSADAAERRIAVRCHARRVLETPQGAHDPRRGGALATVNSTSPSLPASTITIMSSLLPTRAAICFSARFLPLV